MTRSRSAASERPPGFVFRAVGSGVSVLHCEEVALPKLAARYGTPLYIYSASAIADRFTAFERAFPRIEHTVCYSVKANSNLSILRLLARKGCGFDVVSGGELERVLVADKRSVKNVVFSGVGKSREEVRLALKAGILIFNIESGSELAAVAECASALRKTARVAFRVNPDVAAKTHPYIATGLHKHKFGVPIHSARELYAKAAAEKYLKVAGVSVHIGSQIRDAAPFGQAMARVADFVRVLRKDGHNVQYVDIGGGLGISYDQPQDKFAAFVAQYARAVTAPLRGMNVHLLLEPGRSIVGAAGVLLTSVLYRKMNEDKRFLITDAAMNDLIRPALYQAYHEIVPVVRKKKSGPTETVDIVGPVCESGDFFARDRELAAVQEGDLLAILDAGAYGMALSSNYNTRPRPAELLVSGKSVRLIRMREKVSELYAAER